MPSTTPPLKIMLVDDEPMALRVLEAHAQKLAFVEIVFCTTSALEGLLFAQQHPVDGVFLDVQMPELTGIQLIQLLADKAKVILTTAYPQYAVQGFDYDVIDYLLKPISFERFFRAIQKLQRRQPLHDSSVAPALLSPVGRPTGVLFIKTEYKLVKVDHEALLYFQGGKDYTTIFTQTDTLLSLTSLTQFEQSLPRPLTPNQVNHYPIDLHQANHVFRKGHKIMIQVQSSWFPLIDRNPQRYVPSIFNARPTDYQSAVHRIFRSHQFPSHIQLPVAK